MVPLKLWVRLFMKQLLGRLSFSARGELLILLDRPLGLCIVAMTLPTELCALS